jgi:hypothetical protein
VRGQEVFLGEVLVSGSGRMLGGQWGRVWKDSADWDARRGTAWRQAPGIEGNSVWSARVVGRSVSIRLSLQAELGLRGTCWWQEQGQVLHGQDFEKRWSPGLDSLALKPSPVRWWASYLSPGASVTSTTTVDNWVETNAGLCQDGQ